jgi:hypothetical protein
LRANPAFRNEIPNAAPTNLSVTLLDFGSHPASHDLAGMTNYGKPNLKKKGKVKFVVLPVELFETLLDQLEDESDIRTICDAEREPLFNQKEAEEYFCMNPVKRKRLERG